MINLESPLFTQIATALRSAYSGIFVTGEHVPIPAQLPAVSIVEMDNATFRQARTNAQTEQFAEVMYEVNVYSNRTNAKKAEARAIISTIDNMLLSYGFERVMLQPIPNLDDATIYRMIGRYRAVVSDNLTIYRR